AGRHRDPARLLFGLRPHLGLRQGTARHAGRDSAEGRRGSAVTLEERQQPVAGDVPVEVILSRHTAARAVYVAPILVGIFWLTRGGGGALAALLGVAVVVG